MRCSESTEILAAYLHHELSSADDLAMQEHLAECASCRDEHAAMRDVMRRVQGVPPVEPSARARAELHRSIDEAAGKPRLPGPANPGASTQKPSARAYLPFRKLRELPAPPPENVPPATPAQGVTLSPSARVVAERLEYLRHRKRNARIRRIGMYVFGLLLLVGGALAFKHPNWFTKPPHAPAPKPEEARATARWNERHKLKGRAIETLINDQSELGEALAAPLRVIQHLDPRSDEACLIAYNDAGLKLMQASETLEKAALNQELPGSRDLIGPGGKPVIPAEWIDTVFGLDRRAVILNFDDRIEIWSSTKLEKYLNRGPVFDFGI